MAVNPARQRPLPLLPVPGQATTRPMFKSLGIAASGISAQRQRMETIAQNIANANSTRSADGTPYRRREVVLEPAEQNAQALAFGSQTPRSNIGPNQTSGAPAFAPLTGDTPRSFTVPAIPGIESANSGGSGVRVVGVAEDQGEGRLVYEPGHPDADPNGYVRYPDIDATQELVKLLDAKRIYEANASVFQTAKSMLRAALDI